MKTHLSATPRPLHRIAGFTMIELMIAVAIVAILTAIAYPSYRNYVLRGQVTNATTALSQGAANMERVFQDNRTYVIGTGTYPTPCPGAAAPTTAVANGTFNVNCTILTPTTFTMTATGSGSTNGFVYTIDQTGAQTTTIASPAPSAWIISCPSTWSTKAGQC